VIPHPHEVPDPLSGLTPVGLTCEGRTDPLGIDLERGPLRLGWRLQGGRSRGQSAYQLQAADSREALATGRLLWDPGRVEGDRSTWIPWGGPRLRPRDRVAWRVRVWDDEGWLGPWSEPATFELGLLRERDWIARWIAPWYPPPQDEDFEPRLTPAPLLRTEVGLPAGIVRARAYVCGVGFHELWINGRRAGD
jgi:alpha-L-rhamnosidase